MTALLGERFARAVAAQDGPGLLRLLSPEVTFRALTPSRFWEADDPHVAVDEVILGTWFPPDRRITEVLAVDCDQVGPVERVGYRFGVTEPDGDSVVEQQAYLETDGEQIRLLRIMCTGFLRDR